MKRYLSLMVIGLALTACTPKKAEYLGTPITGYNHTSAAINSFTVNGGGGPNIGPYQGGGKENCCATLPVTWRPGLQVVVEWEKDPNVRASRYWPEKMFSPEWRVRMTAHRALFTHHRAVADVAPYDVLGVIQVHFLPCNQIKVAAGIHSPNNPLHPYKFPQKMEEPTTCPTL